LQIYLVGGAVRDQLLGLPIHERDWVVVGSSAEEMLRLGYQPVGKDFPVFLHPESKEEYALARTERKYAKGYQGFQFHADPSVTLEEDLKRRDLTINAIAQTEDGQLIDPYGGKKDIENRCFRHVSEAFGEDPVRILRLARFSARFTDFETHPDTIKLMQAMVVAGEVDALVAERVWKECQRALGYAMPTRFFDQLQAAQALESLFPCGDRFAKNQRALQRACEFSTRCHVRWAAWNATKTEAEGKACSEKYRIPSTYKELSSLVIKHGASYLRLEKETDAEAILHLLIQIGALRDTEKLVDFQQVCSAIATQAITDWNQRLLEITHALLSINTQAFQDAGLAGQDFAHALKEKRLTTIQDMLTR
jgi:tRNA nucleotidyltransferase (CCA-adding enzyme)